MLDIFFNSVSLCIAIYPSGAFAKCGVIVTVIVKYSTPFTLTFILDVPFNIPIISIIFSSFISACIFVLSVLIVILSDGITGLSIFFNFSPYYYFFIF